MTEQKRTPITPADLPNFQSVWAKRPFDSEAVDAALERARAFQCRLFGREIEEGEYWNQEMGQIERYTDED